MKTALITGIRGQDGAYLAKLLLEKGYKVYGADRRSGDSNSWRLGELGIEKEIEDIYMDLLELTNVIKVIETVKPDEVYNLAAQSFVQTSFDQPILTQDINGTGVLRLLEALRMVKPEAKFYQASTSEMFGKVQEIPQTEKTPFYPRSPYAVAKLFGHWIAVNYRESYQMFNSAGILFNHESPLRGIEFITRKLTYGIAQMKHGRKDRIVVGNLDSKRDWGYAPEYVDCIWRMLQQPQPDDYVVATGETHSVREFIELAFQAIGWDIVWEGKGMEEKGIDQKTGRILVTVSSQFFRPAEVEILMGDSSKAREKLGWQPKTKFQDLVNIMTKADLKRVEKELK